MTPKPLKKHHASPSRRGKVAEQEPEALVTQLKEKGFRITKARKAILEILISAERPLSAQEIGMLLERRTLSANKTTIYRELDFLVAQRSISQVDLLDGVKRYEPLHLGHHHHLVCTRCRGIQCVKICGDLKALERTIGAAHGFTVESHTLEFFGICSGCR